MPAAAFFAEAPVFAETRASSSFSDINNFSSEPVENTLCFIGSYTKYDSLPHYPRGSAEGEGIYVFRWLEKKLHLLHVERIENPAVMKYHPKLNVLYVLTECIDKPGFVSAFDVNPANGELTLLNKVIVTGRSTCYLAFDEDASHVVIANYWDAKINVVELDSTGRLGAIVQDHQQTARESFRQVVDRQDHWANRQDGPHAHCSVFHPSFQWLFVPDLGDNCIHQYSYSKGRLTPDGHVPLAPGVGPRHFVFHPTLPVAYSGCELRSSVQVLAVDASEPEISKVRIQPLQRVGALPEDAEGMVSYVGEIKVDAAGKFVYVSNRGHNSIAVFAVDQVTGLLTRVSIDPTLGDCPRHFGISPDGNCLVAADQDSDVVKVFDIVPGKGCLAFTGQEVPLPTPNFVLFQSPRILA